jgi:hypothetical protein
MVTSSPARAINASSFSDLNPDGADVDRRDLRLVHALELLLLLERGHHVGWGHDFLLERISPISFGT